MTRTMRMTAALLALALAGAAGPPPEGELMVPGRRAGFVIAGPNGCWVWIGGLRAGAEAITASWDGACPDGPAEGSGRAEVRWRDAGRDRGMIYEGPLRRGKSEGQGRLTMLDGGRVTAIQQGEFRDDRFAHGRVEVPSAGLVYEGGWWLSHPHGRGTATLGGRVFEGDWINGCLQMPQGWVAFTRPAQECGGRPT